MEKNNKRPPVVIESIYLIYYDVSNRKIRRCWINPENWEKIHRLYAKEDECCWINGTLLIVHDGEILSKGKIHKSEEFISFTNKIICAHHKPASQEKPFVIKKFPCECWEILTKATISREKHNTFIKEGDYAIIKSL